MVAAIHGNGADRPREFFDAAGLCVLGTTGFAGVLPI
jgi:hypothetical protein